MRRFLHRCEDELGKLLIYAIIFLTSAQVFFRYMLNYPLGWTEELARYVFIWAIFLGAAVLARSREHVAVQLLHTLLPARARRYVVLFNDVVIILFLLTILPSALRYAVYAYRLKATVTEIPMFFIYVSLPLSCVLIVLHMIENIIHDLRSWGNTSGCPRKTEEA